MIAPKVRLLSLLPLAAITLSLLLLGWVTQPVAGGSAPSPSGGGYTLTEQLVASFNINESYTLTHPAVALDSGEILFSVLHDAVPQSYSQTANTWTDENLRGTATSFVFDSGTKGHFYGGAPDVRVQVGCVVEGRYITAITPPGTGPSSVTLTTSSANFPVSSIYCLYGQGEMLYPYQYTGIAADYAGAAIAYSITDTLVVSSNVPSMGGSLRLTATNSGAVVNPRGAISLDGGTTWLAFDGSDWVAITSSAASLLGDGMRIQTEDWLGADNAALDEEDWIALQGLMVAAGDDLDARLIVGMDPDGVNWNVLSAIHITWNGVEEVTQGVVGSEFSMGGGGEPNWTVNRTSTTQAVFTGANGFSGWPKTNVRIQARTPAE